MGGQSDDVAKDQQMQFWFLSAAYLFGSTGTSWIPFSVGEIPA
jgi:hypothetical protein